MNARNIVVKTLLNADEFLKLETACKQSDISQSKALRDSKIRSDFEAWWSEFQETHEEWPFADREALLFAAWENALSQQLAQELIPYAYIRNELGRGRYHESWALCGANADGALPLYTSPPNYEALCAENEALKLKLAAMEPKP